MNESMTRPESRRAALLAAIGVATCMLAFAAPSHGHHSGAAIYIPSETVEIQGVVERVFWRNPHVHLLVRTTTSDGAQARWDVETNSVSILARMGIDAEMIAVGDRVNIAGWPARRPVNEMFATNLLLPSGQEVLLLAGAPARWTNDVVGSSAAWVTDGDAVSGSGEAPRGIFRVWSTNMANPGSFPLFNDVMSVEQDYPLTEKARAARRAWDPVQDNPYLSCAPMGMPRVMGQPYPMEFVDAGDSIVLRIELYDTERRIWLDPQSVPGNAAPDILGTSIGHWEGRTLVVATTRVGWPYFDQSGVPLSGEAEIVERFTPSDDGSRLNYAITVTDPETFSAPVTLTKYWTWRPDEQVRAFDCQEFESGL